MRNFGGEFERMDSKFIDGGAINLMRVNGRPEVSVSASHSNEVIEVTEPTEFRIFGDENNLMIHNPGNHALGLVIHEGEYGKGKNRVQFTGHSDSPTDEADIRVPISLTIHSNGNKVTIPRDYSIPEFGIYGNGNEVGYCEQQDIAVKATAIIHPDGILQPGKTRQEQPHSTDNQGSGKSIQDRSDSWTARSTGHHDIDPFEDTFEDTPVAGSHTQEDEKLDPSRPSPLSDSERLDFELRDLQHRQQGQYQAEEGIIPKDWADVGFRFEGDKLIYGDSPDSDSRDRRRPWEIVHDSQVDILKLEGANEHPLIVATRANFVRGQDDDLGDDMTRAIPVIDYIAKKRDSSLSGTIDEIHQIRGVQINRDWNGLRAFWRDAYFYGATVFNLDEFCQGIDQTPDIQISRNLIESHVFSNPVAVLNCLSAAKLYSHEEPIRAKLMARPETYTPDELTEFKQNALRLLSSNHVIDRPYITWYLLSLSSVWRTGSSRLSPLLETIEEADKPDNERTSATIAKLDRANELVKRVLGNQWDEGLSWKLGPVDWKYLDGRISGALEYGESTFYRYGKNKGLGGSEELDQIVKSFRTK